MLCAVCCAVLCCVLIPFVKRDDPGSFAQISINRDHLLKVDDYVNFGP
jgi:hypothetical protein